MENILDLKELGGRLARVDLMLMMLLKRRIELAHLVARFKMKMGQKFIRLKVENQRIAVVRKWARENGVNPNFAEQVLYAAINESCKQQLIDLQKTGRRRAEDAENEEERYRSFKRNLVKLTARWAPKYDGYYDAAFFATHEYIEYERLIMEREIDLLKERGKAIDLGCATGRLTFRLAEQFDATTGYDLSPAMIRVARSKLEKEGLRSRGLGFQKADLEEGIDEKDSSVSMAVMNMGTGSDVRNIAGVTKETARILRSDGRFLFSFYNKDALVYRWDFLPWPTGLAANINASDRCLNVTVNRSVLQIYARPFTVKEVGSLFSDSGLVISTVTTYPTVSSILPSEFLEKQPDVQKAIAAIDQQLANSDMGAYIIATGYKR